MAKKRKKAAKKKQAKVKDFYRHAESSDFFCVETRKDGTIVGSCSVESSLIELDTCECTADNNQWIRKNSSKLVLIPSSDGPILWSEMCDLGGYIEKLIADLRYCLSVAKEQSQPQGSALLKGFEQNVNVVVGILEPSQQRVAKWKDDVYKKDRRFIAQRTRNEVIKILESFGPFGDAFPQIRRFLDNHTLDSKGEVKKGYSNINKKIHEIVHKCGRSPRKITLSTVIKQAGKGAIGQPAEAKKQKRGSEAKKKAKKKRTKSKAKTKKKETKRKPVAKKSPEKLPKHTMTIIVAVKEFKVTRLTLLRKIKDGKLKSYRPTGCSKTTAHIIDAVEVARLYPRRK